MANLTTSGTSGYPASIDTSTTLVDGTDEIIAENVNGPTAAVINIETELGTAPKGSATDVVTRLNVSQNADGTIKSSVIVAATNTTVSYSGGVFTLSAAAGGKLSGDLVQMLSTQITGFTTTNGIIPIDTTPPQSSEGAPFFTVNMKPTSALNSVYVSGSLSVADSAVDPACALFLAGSSSAVAAWSDMSRAVNVPTQLSFLYKVQTVSAATTAYTLNVGSNGAATLTLNGASGAGLFGNIMSSILTVYEVQN